MKATIIFQATEKDVPRLKELIADYAQGPIQVLAPFCEVDSTAKHENEGDLDLAKKIAEAIRPRGKQTMRKEALRAALGGYDTFFNQGGEDDGAMQVALAALSKALRPFAPYGASPMDLIAVRERQYFKEGSYQGTKYFCTQLGEMVRNELKTMDAI